MFEIRTRSRSCAGCTRCCEGWLTGEAWGHRFSPGRPCGWRSSSGCLIYENRPHNPCRTFECEWKRQASIPEWLKPDLSGVILVNRVIEQHEYIRVIDCGQPISAKVHDWAREFSHAHSVNLLIPTEQGVCAYSEDSGFLDAVSKVYNLVKRTVD